MNFSFKDTEISLLEKNMPLVYGQNVQDAEMAIAADLLITIRTRGRIDKRVLYREFISTINIDTYENLIKSLIATGYIRLIAADGTFYLIATDTGDD